MNVLALMLSAAMAAPAAAPSPASPGPDPRDPDHGRVVSLVSSIPLAIDLGAFDLAARAFAPQVRVDYTSLWGGEAQAMTPEQLIDSWKGIVPGFTATWHELRDVRAEVDGDAARASAFVDGRHWLEGALWRPVGHYHWELARREGRWVVTAMTFAMTHEYGDRGLVEQAMARARAPAP